MEKKQNETMGNNQKCSGNKQPKPWETLYAPKDMQNEKQNELKNILSTSFIWRNRPTRTCRPLQTFET